MNDKNRIEQPITRDEFFASGSTVQELAPIVEMISVQDFWRAGVVPVAYNNSNRKLELVFCGTIAEEGRRAILDCLPNITIEWYKVNDTELDAIYQRISQQLSAKKPLSESCYENNNLSAGSEAESPEIVLSDVSENKKADSLETLDNTQMPPAKKTLLFITPAGTISQHLKAAIYAELLDFIVVKSVDQATDELKRRKVISVFIHENLRGKKDRFVKHIQKAWPGLPVRCYRSEVSLLINDTQDETIFELVRQNLALLSRINSRRGSAISSHAAAVAKFADRVAIQLGIPGRQRLLISTAAFLHNMAEDELSSTEGLKQADIIGLSASKLESWGFLPIVPRMLRRMYSSMETDETAPDYIEVMCACILTASDLFCHLWPEFPAVRVETDDIREKLENELQGLVSPSVTGSLVDVVHDDYSAKLLDQGKFSVHLFDSRDSQPNGLVKAIQDAGFVVTFSSSIDDCVQGCFNSSAALLIIRDSGSLQEVYDTLMSLALNNVDLERLHTMLLLDTDIVCDAFRLLSHGIEEILPNTAQPQAVITKIDRIKKRNEEQYRHRMSAIKQLGTHGSLADLSLIGILESFRGNRQTARISVTASSNQLTVYVENGKVIAAECEGSTGLSALMMGVSWRQGVWSFESINSTELPKPNINENIDSVLIAACTRLDQISRDTEISQESF